MGEPVEDLVAQCLASEGIKVSDYQLYGTDDNPVPGDGEKSFQKGNVKIVYRLKNRETLVIILYEALQKASGISNPFHEFLWFIDFLKTRNTGVKRVEGMAKVFPGEHVSVLQSQRLAQFYKRWLNAKVAETMPHGGEWLYGYLDEVRPLNYKKEGTS